MIRLEKVNDKTFRKVVNMKLNEPQSNYVAPNVVSLAQAWLYYDNARPYAILNDEEVVGFMMLDWDEEERSVGVWRFMIGAEYQHRGYGRQALQLAIELAKNSPEIDMMYLDYVKDNTNARELYASLGFAENGKVEDGEIIMTKPLTTTPKIGCVTADADDLEEISQLIAEQRQRGEEFPCELIDEEKLKQIIEQEQIKRFTLMGETVGVGYKNFKYIKQ